MCANIMGAIWNSLSICVQSRPTLWANETGQDQSLAACAVGSAVPPRRIRATKMRLGKLLVYFETSPALRLLRSQNLPFVLDFFDRQFKQSGRISVPHSDMLAALIAYQEDLEECYPGRFTAKAESYLTDWCSSETRWLQRLLEAGRDEPVYQLTPHTEDVFVFLDRVLDQDLGFVGTESRLKIVIDTLADLVIGSSDDPEVRLKHLRSEHTRIQSEIEQIEREGRVGKYQPAQIRERFATAVSLLRQLQSDFRAVEDSFRDITMQVQQRQVAGQETRGRILEFALDEEELLKQDDQGVSFYEFVRLVLSPSQTDRLEQIIADVRRIPELTQQQEGLETVRGMVTLLQSEAEKVMRTNQRLSTTLRRLLDARAHAERQRIAQLLRDIKGLAVGLALPPDEEHSALSLELDLAIDSPFRRLFWVEPPQFDAVDLTCFEPDAEDRNAAFSHLASLRNLNWSEMRLRIRQILTLEEAPTLGDLLTVYPAEGGVVEVIGYLQIAVDDGHLVDSGFRQTVSLSAGSFHPRPVLVTVPRVTFLPHRRNHRAR